MARRVTPARDRAVRIGIDIGGTFTDVIAVGRDAVIRQKVLSTTSDFSSAVLMAIRQLGGLAGPLPSDFDAVLHGTTVATNAILESRGATTAIITTRGFRDLLEIARMRRPQLYDTMWVKPKSLVPRRLRFELDQRITADKSLEPAFEPRQVRDIVSSFSTGVKAVAVCLINSHLRPDEERRVCDEIRAMRPDLFVSASVDVSPEIGEFERLSTAVVNSYVGPVVEGYLVSLEHELKRSGFSGPLLLMHSDGGLVTSRGARARPVHLVESGPAAGVMATKSLAARMGYDSAIAFDMGGTTAKASLVEDGEPFDLERFEVGGGMTARRGVHMGGGYAVRIPCLDIAEIGAGGGSIIWVDAGGSPRVGPHSAAAHPGPACYGAGGVEPTLTDANVVLGYLDRATLGGGTQAIDRQLAHAAVERVATMVGLSVLDMAFGAYQIAVANMTRVIKAVTSERGRDPRESVIIAFGGAGPAYAATMAQELGIKRAVIPASPGLFSAVGLLATTPLRTATRQYDGSTRDVEALDAAFRELGSELSADMRADGLADGGLALERFADMRYRGQRFELRIPVRMGRLTRSVLVDTHELFHREHLRTFSYRREDNDVEIARIRVRAASIGGKANAERTLKALGRDASRQAPDHLEAHSRSAYFGAHRGFMDTPVLRRSDLMDHPLPGPVIIDEMDTSILVPPGAAAHRDEFGNVLIDVA